jgi:hypothetical protein
MLWAKVAALGAVMLLEVGLTVVGVWGYHPGLWPALAAAALLFGQAMGVVFLCAGYFESLTSFIMAGALLTGLTTAPVMSFFASGFPDLWWMPTYAPFRALREAFFPTGRPELIASSLAVGAAVTAALLAAGAAVYRRRLQRAG